MSDRDLIGALRWCSNKNRCIGCPGENACEECSGKAVSDAADRLEALMAENAALICKRSELERENGRLEVERDYLRATANTHTKWVSVEERLPEEQGRYLCNVKSFAFPGCTYISILQYDKYGFREENIYTDAVTHWMPLPSTEGVE